ncbi:MAG TPA: M14 family zinc carboxypeptidase [Steroidobacteraceae bacterium]|nr:M14 family zinc carboxypeptidase [Steroidobacteraceae bacterium]
MYRTVSQIESAISILASWFPNFFTRIELPETSVEGRTVSALRLRAGGGSSRRGVLVVGGTHARELMNPDAIVDLAIDLFLSYTNGTGHSYGNRSWTAEDIKIILESLDIWLLPCSNPDGRNYVMTADSLWRKNRRQNANTTCMGVDLNRNADIVWGVAQGQTSCSPCSDVYCGPGAFSEPETRNVKWLLDSERILSFVDVHSYSELVLYPWGHAPTQTTDPTKQFTGITTGTCTASIPGSYSEYMPPIDLQRFTTVAHQIASDIQAVRGRQYTVEPSIQLYPTTGTQGDYAYSRHLANAAYEKTYGFTFETGPWAGTVQDSFHPMDPSAIQNDAKAAILSLLQQSVCSIELIGLSLFAKQAPLDALRTVRDRLLATTAAGREWVALFERVQFPLLSVVLKAPKLLESASELLRSLTDWVMKDDVKLDQVDLRRAQQLIRQLAAGTKDRALRADLAAVSTHLSKVAGRPAQAVVAHLLRHRPATAGKQSTKRPAKTTRKRKAEPLKKRHT